MLKLESRGFYASYLEKVAAARAKLRRPLLLSEKILYSHLFDSALSLEDLNNYAEFRPDRVAMQDATAQMTVLQFMNAGKEKVCVPASVHCDHLICAREGVKKDLPKALEANEEVYSFLSSASKRYGIDFWEPGAGIIHQIVLENYAMPGAMMVGTDSHTPNAGGLGMIAVGVGGADAVDVISGMPWELKIPQIIGVRLNGGLSGWASPKDVILYLAGMLTTKGGTNSIIEYFGEGADSLSCTGKASICNMGAEMGCTCSIFPFDDNMAAYLKATGRKDVAEEALKCASELRPDEGSEQYYDRIIEIDLSSISPYVNGPFTPDAACPASLMKERVACQGFPRKVEVCLIGSCTNSSYQDLARAASVARQALDKGLKPKAQLIVNPGSSSIKATAERDGILQTLREAGAIIMTNACGPCIGQWERIMDDPQRANTIVTTFNRNFAKRADGNPNTHAFIVSPEMAVAMCFAGVLDFNPVSDLIDNVRLDAPFGEMLPPEGFAETGKCCVSPVEGSPEPVIREGSERIQRLRPFEPWEGKDFRLLPLLIKIKGKCTTDHISMAGPWLRFRGHLQNISENLLMGAVDAFTGKTGPVAPRARELGRSIVVAEDNYGEGSSREHAAMEPRYLGIKVILAKSFARIHETNLKKQGILALTFKTASDYDKILPGDMFDVHCEGLSPGKPVKITVRHYDGSYFEMDALHTYNAGQIEWFRAGSALNSIAK